MAVLRWRPPGDFLFLLCCLCLLPGGLEADDFVVGIGTHSAPPRALDLIQNAGIPSLRDDIHWAEIEREKGTLVMPERYEWYVTESLRRGIDPVLVLCYGNKLYDGAGYPVSGEAMEAYARFAEFVVSTFRGRVRHYEIWNEWNIGISLPPGTPHGEPEPYVALLHKVYPRLKAIDPAATIIGGALSGNGVEKGWLEAACRAGLLDNLDAFSFHPYCYRQGAGGRLPENGFLHQIHDSQEVTRRYRKRDLPIYITEVGWPTHNGPDGSTPDEAARFLARAYLLARTLPFVRGLWWYDLRDDGIDPREREDHFGVLTHDYLPKPAFAALTGVCRWFRTARFVREIETGPATRVIEFREESGAALFALWSRDEPGAHVTLEIDARAARPQTKLHEIGGREIACEWRQVGPGSRLAVPLTASPRVLECDPAPAGAVFRAD